MLILRVTFEPKQSNLKNPVSLVLTGRLRATRLRSIDTTITLDELSHATSLQLQRYSCKPVLIEIECANSVFFSLSTHSLTFLCHFPPNNYFHSTNQIPITTNCALFVLTVGRFFFSLTFFFLCFTRFQQTKGLHSLPRLVIFTSEDAHYSIKKLASFMGIGSDNVYPIRTDAVGKIQPDHLGKTAI